jgi:hypothetical protein
MKKAFLYLSLLCLCLSLPVQGNLLSNASFEKTMPEKSMGWRVELFEGWELLLNSGAEKCRITAGEDAFEGTHSLRLQTLGESGFCSANHKEKFPVSQGQEVSASVQIKGTGAGYIRVYFHGADGKRLKEYEMMEGAADDEWQPIVMKFIVPPGVAKLEYSLQTLKDNADVLFDDARLMISSGDTLENEFLRVRINARVGGGIDSFVSKKNNFDFTTPASLGKNGGLMNIVLPDERLPGVLMEIPFTRVSADGGKNIYIAKLDSGEYAGLAVRRSYQLQTDSATLNVDTRLVNEGTETIKVAHRIQSRVSSESGVYSWPTPDWVTIFKQDGSPLGGMDSIIQDLFRTGWQAKFYDKLGMSLVFEYDAAKVSRMYTYLSMAPNASSIEWYCRELTLEPGKSSEHSTKVRLLDEQTQFHADAYGRGQGFEVIKPAQLPPPPEEPPLPPQFENYFVFGADTGNLFQPEIGGYFINVGGMKIYKKIQPRLVRKLVDGYFNTFSPFRIFLEKYLLSQKTPEGGYLIGDLSRKYDLKMVPSTIFMLRKDLEVDKYMQEEWPKKKKFLENTEFQNFLRLYSDRLLCTFTADEILPQNADVMLHMHRELLKYIPEHAIPIPYLNSSSTDLIPYVPVFIGDWYPIKRADSSGRNPWNVYPEFSRVVKLAGSKPVWFMPQGFGTYKNYAFPTAGETRLMVHLSVAAGVRGVFWHGFPGKHWPWMMKYPRYPYSHIGGGGQHTPSWQGIRDLGRTFATVGPLLYRATVIPLPEQASISCGEYESPNHFYRGAAARLFALALPKGTIFLAVNQNPYGEEKVSITLPGKVFDLNKLAPGKTSSELSLAPGDAAYFACDLPDEELELAFRSRFHAEASRYILRADRAKGAGIPVADLQELRKMPAEKALTSLFAEFERLDKAVQASPLGKTMASIEEIRDALDEIDFRLCSARKLIVTPEMEEETKLYARWTAHPDEQYEELRGRLAWAFGEFYRIIDMIDTGTFTAELADAANALHPKAIQAAKDAHVWLDKHPERELIDDPYEGMR